MFLCISLSLCVSLHGDTYDLQGKRSQSTRRQKVVLNIRKKKFVCLLKYWILDNYVFGRAKCNFDATALGTMKRPPVSYSVDEALPAKASLLYWIPTLIIIMAFAWLNFNPQAGLASTIMTLIGAWGHFGLGRAHGDQNGGKMVPTFFILIMQIAGMASGTPSLVLLSLQRILILFTYFMTGFRKFYVVGFRWADGANLQLMTSIQGLYHDLDNGDGLEFNFALAKSRTLCRIASVSVLGLQLIMPFFLVLDSLWPQAGIMMFAFWLAMSFHAGNHIFWRINFFGSWCPALLTLLVPIAQLSPSILYQRAADGSATLPCSVLIIYLSMQLGHALDKVLEKMLERARQTMLSGQEGRDIGLLRKILLQIIFILELHLLGDYYTSYFPDSHPQKEIPVACVVIKYKDGSEVMLPAPIDFYWRRHINAWVKWPDTVEGQCVLEAQIHPGMGTAQQKNLANDTKFEVRKKENANVGFGGMEEVGNESGNYIHVKMENHDQKGIRKVETAGGETTVDDVTLSTTLRRIQCQFESSYLLSWTVSSFRKSGGELYLRVRKLEYVGTSINVKRLWECKFDLGLPQKVN